MLKYQGHVFDVMPACTCCVVGDAPQAVMVDPTGTGPIRTRFRTTTRIKWQQLRSLIREMIVTSDLLQLRAGGLLALTNPAIVGGAGKLQGFQNWIDLALEKVVLETTGGFMKPFINQAYEAGQAFASSVVGVGHASVDARSREDLIHALAVIELQGIMEAVSQQAVRAVANGLLNNKRPLAIVRDIWGVIERIGQTRTKTMIELIVVKAFGDATLDVYASVGITEVGLIPEGVLPIATTDARKKRASNIGRRAKAKLEREAAKAAAEAAAEAAKRLKEARRAAGAKSAAKARQKRGGPGSRSRFSTPGGSTIARIENVEAKIARLGSVYVRTAGDDDVCKVCERIERGGPYKIDTARQLIPAHPHCRCVFIPANDKRFKRRLKSDTRDLEDFEDSVPASLRTALTDMYMDSMPALVAQLIRDAGGGNPNHDPETGEFSSGEGGRGGDPNDPQMKYTNDEFGFVPGAKTHNMKVMSDWLKSKGYTVVEMKPSKNKAAAYYSPSNDSFGLNKANPVFENPAVVMRANYKAGHLSNAHPMALVHHEEGHKLYSAPANFMNNIDERALVKKHLSNYAAMNPNEVIAEVHAARMAGMKIHPEIEAMFNRYAKKRGTSGKMYGDAKGDGVPDDAIVEIGMIKPLPRRLFTDSMGQSTFSTPGTSYAEATTQPNPVAPLNSRMPGGGVSPKRPKRTPKGKHKKRRGHK